ncbi:major facilitator superfamily domain-containing protein [Lipomyces kononenkoae]|uniref:Major facilitator superfamily domain-containing protein n=1 Tax=Lipomyces kononenkoae TaxID=34357 RepID=A0ACC3T5Q2_LIPKO
MEQSDKKSVSVDPVAVVDEATGAADDEKDASPPDGGYGWVCVAACFTVNCFSWGIVASYGVYLSHYLSNQVYPDASAFDFAFVGGFNFSMAMLVAPFVTILAREYGIRFCMIAGAIMESGGFVAASFSSRIWQLYLTQGLLVGFGVGFVYIPSMAVLSQWFERKRSLANGISSAGSGIGGAVFSWATEAMINQLGLQWALRVTGIIIFIANMTAALVIRDRNRHIRPPQLALDTKLLRRYDVLLLLSWAFISMLGYITILFSLSDFALSIGLSHSQATDIVGLLNIGTAVGRPIIGIWSDRYSRIDVAGLLTLLCGLCCFAFWLPSTSFGLTVFFALVIGAILGVFWLTIGPICVEVAGLKELQSLLSLSWMSIILPTTFSEVIGLELRRPGSSREYLYPQIFSGLCYIVASAFMFELRRVKRREHLQNS